MRRFLCAAILCTCITQALRAQVTIVPLPRQEGYFQLEEIWRVNLINSLPNPISVRLEIVLEDGQHQAVLTATSPVFMLQQGSNRPAFNLTSGQIQYGNTQAAATLRNSGRLPYGSYIRCYRVIHAAKNNLLGQNCQEHQVKPFGPPELVSPYNREVIHTNFPVLTWKAPFPQSATPVVYRLHLVEVHAGQIAMDAIERNIPLLSQQIEQRNQLPYPGDVARLEKGKQYAWQISARSGDFDLGTTDVWVFTVGEYSASELAGDDPTYTYETYFDLKLAPSGGFLPGHKSLKFRYDNRLAASVIPYLSGQEVFYEIYPAGNRSTPVGGMPDLPLHTGVNKITIQLDNNPNMQDGKDYLLVVKDTAGITYYLDFIYFSE